MISIGIAATLCEVEGELSHMDIGNYRVASLEQALDVIRQPPA